MVPHEELFGPPSGELFRMISIEECKKHIGGGGLTDKQIEEVRDLLYAFAEHTLDLINISGSVVSKKIVWKTSKKNKVKI